MGWKLHQIRWCLAAVLAWSAAGCISPIQISESVQQLTREDPASSPTPRASPGASPSASPKASPGASPSASPKSSPSVSPSPSSSPSPVAEWIGPTANPVALPAFETRYYVDALAGSDSNDGKAPERAWKSLAQVTAASSAFKPGDAVLLRAGRTYPGSFRIEAAGVAGKPIMVSRFGDGSRPVLSGWTRLEGWTALGGGIWEATCAACGESLRQVLLDGQPQPIARYPKKSASNGGYLTIQSHVGSTSLTSDHVQPADWTGGEIVIRKHRWVIDRLPIESQVGGTFKFPAASYPVQDRFGYFIINHPKAVTLPGEWAYVPKTRKLRLHFGTMDPAQHEVRVSSVDVIARLSNLKYIELNQVELDGANSVAVDAGYSTGIRVINSIIRRSGWDGISGIQLSDLTVESCELTDSGNTGLTAQLSPRIRIRKNIVRRSGIEPGLGRSGDGTYNAIMISGADDSRVELNQVDRAGYCGIWFSGERILVKNNLVQNTVSVKDDGGGIYTFRSESEAYSQATKSQIVGNIVLDGPGASAGTDPGVDNWVVNGIYLDGHSANVDVIGNTVSGFRKSGMFYHTANLVTADGNTFVANGSKGLWDDGAQVVMASYSHSLLRNSIFLHNILVSRVPSVPAYLLSTDGDDLRQFGVFDQNLIVNPLTPNPTVQVRYTPAGGAAKWETISFDSWKNTYGKDAQSRVPALKLTSDSEWSSRVRLETNPSTIPKTVTLDGTWADPKGNSYSGTVTLPAFGSVVLFRK